MAQNRREGSLGRWALRCVGSAAAFVALGSLCGCTTVMEQRRNDEMRQQTRVGGLETDVGRLADRVERLDEAQQDLVEKLSEAEASDADSEAELRQAIVELKRDIDAAAVARETMRLQIVEEVSKRVAKLLQSQASQGVSSQGGYEHPVQPGETLSAIADAYKVEVSAIVKANHLANPDAIKVGQTLFIPK